MSLKSWCLMGAVHLALVASHDLRADVVFVSATQQTNNPSDGLSWATALPDLTSAMELAQSGDDIWVAAGHYVGSIRIKSGVAVYGGFAGTEAVVTGRDWTQHRTTLDGGGTNSVIVVEEGAADGTSMDGFTITNGWGIDGGGVYCMDAVLRLEHVRLVGNVAQSRGGGLFLLNAVATLQDCVLSDNRAGESGGGIFSSGSSAEVGNSQLVRNLAGTNPAKPSGRGGAVYCSNPQGNSALMAIRSCLLRNNQAGSGGGVSADSGAQLLLESSAVAFNFSAGIAGGGVECYASSPVIRNNRFIGNQTVGTFMGGGAISVFAIAPDVAAPLLENNAILGNASLGTGGRGGGIFCSADAAPLIRNNTLVGNSSASGASISSTSAGALIVNNIIAWHPWQLEAPEQTVVHNCFFGSVNDAAWVLGRTNANFLANPGFTPRLVYGDIHLSADSPCRNAGTDVFGLPDTDLDGESRVLDGLVDVGADEWQDSTPVRDPLILRVAPDGSPDNDGLSWSTPLADPADAADHAAAQGGEVWVASGTYPTSRLALHSFNHLFGGFGGTETTREERTPDLHPTVLDAAGMAPLVVSSNAAPWTVLDGFHLVNGQGDKYGGITLVESSPTLNNNYISGHGGRDGGAFYIRGGAPLLSNNTIVTNTSRGAGGIYLVETAAVLSNNIVAWNSGWTAGGIGGSLSASGAILKNRIFSNNVDVAISKPSQAAGGVFLMSTASAATTVAGNWIADNVASNVIQGARIAGGIRCSELAATRLVNNSIVGNTASPEGIGGVSLPSASPGLVFANNLVTSNSSGVGSTADIQGFSHNNVVANGVDYVGLDNPTGTGGNISEDPQLGQDRLHLLVGSPCIDAGLSSVAALASGDLDAAPRWVAASVDIGADEFPGSPAWTPLWEPFAPGSFVVTNVGGITYAWFEAPAGDDCRMVFQPASVQSSAPCFYGRFELLSSDQACGDPVIRRYAVVLGTPPAGAYFVDWSSWGISSGVVPFDVPAEVEPTLIAQPRNPGEQPEFLVQGVAGVVYHVYQSSDLTSWELVETHLDAPFTFTPPVDTPSAGFFQTRIESAP